MSRKTMIEAIRDCNDVTTGLDENVVVFGEDVGLLLAGGFASHAGPAGEYG